MAFWGNDKGWQKFKKKFIKREDPFVKVGILASKGGNSDHGGITMVELAAIHEFGAPSANIPERSFIRRTFSEKSKDMAKVVTGLTKKVASDSLNINQALEILGAWGAAQVKNTITGEHIPPPLKPETAKRKGSTRPLVADGQLLNSITWEVKE